MDGSALSESHLAWALESFYLAQGLVTITYLLSPQRIVLGGGVMKRSILWPLLRHTFILLLNNYHVYEDSADVGQYIVPTKLGMLSGLRGGFLLAADLLHDDSHSSHLWEREDS